MRGAGGGGHHDDVHDTAPGITASVTGQGPDVILLHSLLTDRGVWDLVVPELARERRVWVADLPGYGGSPPAPPDIAAYADRIAAFMDDHDLPDDTAVIGNGLGAMVALMLAVRHGSRVGALVLAGAAAHFPGDSRKAFSAMAGRVRDGGMAAVVDLAVPRIFTEEYLRAHPEVFDERKAVLLRSDPAAFAAACAALEAFDIRAELPTITNPTLVLVGDQDQATPPVRARELVSGIPDAEMVLLPDCAHAPPLQQPKAFLAAVGPFLGVRAAG